MAVFNVIPTLNSNTSQNSSCLLLEDTKKQAKKQGRHTNSGRKKEQKATKRDL